MRNKWMLAAAIVQLFFGILAIASFVILAVNKEKMLKWIPALLVAIWLVYTGISGIISFIKGR